MLFLHHLVLITALGLRSVLSSASQIPLQASSSSNGDGETSGLDNDTRRFIQHVISHFHVPGLSIAVLQGNDTIFDAFGYAIDKDTPARPETLYYIASLTKAFTAATLLHTLQAHNSQDSAVALSMDSRLHDILGDDFVLPSEYATQYATLKDALGHRLGMASNDVSYGGANFTVRDAVRSLRDLPMLFELRAQFHYLNMGYMALQHVVQTLTGRWIGDVHSEALWEPLAMNDTTIRLADALASQDPQRGKVLSHGYSWDPHTNVTRRATWTDTELVGGGGIISNVVDLAKWLRGFLDGTLPASLGEEAVQTLTTPLMLTGDEAPWGHSSPLLYAMGWMTSFYRGEQLVAHSGGINGYSTHLAFMPGRKWGIVLLGNEDYGAIFANNAIFAKLMDDALGIPEDGRDDLVSQGDVNIEQSVMVYRSLRDILYPNVPEPPIPRTLPLEAYAGKYYHPGFREMNFRVEPRAREDLPVRDPNAPVLRTELHRFLNFTVDTEWVSGDHFVSWIGTEVPSGTSRGATKAQCKVDQKGEKVVACGIDISEPGSGVLTWFEKIEEEGNFL